MAVIQKRGSSYRVLIRKKGHAPISKTFKLKALAERWARETEVGLDAGTFRSERATVGETVIEYRRRMAQLGKEIGRSKKNYLDIIQREIGEHRLADLTTEFLVDWISEKSCGPSTRQQYIIYLRTVLTTAETLWDAQPDLVAFEKAARFLRKHGAVSESNQRDRRVTDAELERLIAACAGVQIPYEEILRFQIASAFRIGETCRLRWADLDEQNRTIVIRQRKHPRKKRDEIAPLLGEAWQIVQRQARSGEFIFPYDGRSVGAGVTRAVKRAALGDLHLHDLRHEAISRLFEQGYGITEVQLCSGHKDLKMLQRYLHLRPADLHDGPVAVRQARLRLVA
jgi:integrase